MNIATSRLQIRCHTPESIALLNDRSAMLRAMQLEQNELHIEAEYLPHIQGAIPWWQEQTTKHPEAFHWFAPWEIVLTAENCSIGGIGFAGPPNDEGKVMIGYHIDQRYRQKGFVTEALNAMVAFAFENKQVLAVTATVPPANTPSRAALVRCGFAEMGTDVDDGMEVIVCTKNRIE
jgi:[ribosomal protein S5]-alanine N-acetyltransferase